MKHLILTRFNVVMPGWKGQVNLNNDWLNTRFELFEEVCLPSVAMQTNQAFSWVVFFDSNTPIEYKSKIEALTKVYSFNPVYVDVFDLTKIRPILFKQYGGETMLLTSRLDSDDVLSVSYVEETQAIASKLKDKSVINFDNGLILLSRNSKHALYEYQDKSNPFTSLFESFDANFSSILAISHTDLHQFAEVIHVSDRPMWLQLVHGGNVSNRVRGFRVMLNQYNQYFHYLRLVSEGVDELAYQIHFDNYILGGYRKCRDWMRSLIKAVYLKVKNS